MKTLSGWMARLPAMPTFAAALERAAKPEYPHAVVDITHEALHVMVLSKGQDRHRLQARWYVQALPQGLVEVSHSDFRITHSADFGQYLQRAFHPLGGLPPALSVMFPEYAMRFALLDLNEMPPSERERRDHLMWKMSGKLLYPAHEAALAYEVEVVEAPVVRFRASVAAVRRSALERLDEIMMALGVRAGFMTPSALTPVAVMSLPGNVLHAQVRPSAMTLTYTLDGMPRLFRTRLWTDETPEQRREDASRMIRGTMRYLREHFNSSTPDAFYVRDASGSSYFAPDEFFEELGCMPSAYPWPPNVALPDRAAAEDLAWFAPMAWLAAG